MQGLQGQLPWVAQGQQGEGPQGLRLHGREGVPGSGVGPAGAALAAATCEAKGGRVLEGGARCLGALGMGTEIGDVAGLTAGAVRGGGITEPAMPCRGGARRTRPSSPGCCPTRVRRGRLGAPPVPGGGGLEAAGEGGLGRG